LSAACMAVPAAMPKLGMTMREGRVVAWPRPVGAPVEKGEIILVIETEKAEVEIEAPARGVLRYLYVAEGETVPSGTLLAAITATPERRGTGAPITPAARALARELHVDPACIAGSGTGGRVTREDVEAWAA